MKEYSLFGLFGGTRSFACCTSKYYDTMLKTQGITKFLMEDYELGSGGLLS